MRPPFLLLPFAVIGLLGVTGCGRHQAKGPAETAASALPVRVALAEVRTETDLREVTGTLRPLARAVVASRVMGKVARADFAIGQRVAADETLITLDAEENTARLAQAEAASNQARRDYERESGLLAKGVATTESVRSLADRLRIAEAAEAEARTLRNYTTITAPFAGVITQKLVNAGDLALPGTPLFALEGTSDLRAEVEVPASLPLIPIGATLRVRLPAAEVTGPLVELSSAADPLTRTRLAKVALPADTNAVHAQSGAFIRVAWPAGETTAITVPADAISVMGQMERVFVVRDGHAQLRLVKTAGETAANTTTNDHRVRIAAGIDAGETVVLAPSPALRDGQLVELLP